MDPSGGDEANVVAQLLGELAPRLEQLDWQRTLQSWFVRHTRPGGSEGFPAHLSFRRFIRLPSTRVTSSPDPERPDLVRCVVRVLGTPGQSTISMASEATKVLEWIEATRKTFDLEGLIAAFPDFDEQDLEALTLQLAQVGVLRPVPDWDW
jgi:hypothetical protein